ncbi:MAG TPA: VOC family protein [Thermoleophilaceae bacterium]|nr:VOC family protein [Thermoleophilaceae bacterium]
MTSPRAIGINHVALEVGDLGAAVQFYRDVFGFPLRGEAPGAAFLDMGDQFLALSEHSGGPPDGGRHFGLVVDDRDAVREALAETAAEILPGRGLDFRDPWGNRVQVVEYADVQFTKAPHVLEGMGAAGLGKTEGAREELARKGMVP